MTDVDDPRPQDHPLIEDLVAFIDGNLDSADAAIVAAHLERCRWCSDLLRDVAPATDGDSELLDGYDFVPTPALPVTDEPRPGEIWQLDWDDDALLAVVLEHDADGYVVAALSREHAGRPDLTLRLHLDSAPDLQFYAWNVIASVPLGVFDHPVAMSSEAALEAVRSWASASGAGGSTEQGFDLRIFELDGVSLADDLHMADLAAALSGLAAAEWVPSRSLAVREMRALFAEQNLRPGRAAELSGLAPAVITDLVRGRRQATEAEAAALAPVLAVSPDELRQRPQLPVELLEAVQRPSLRAVVRRRASAQHVSEAQARVEVIDAVFALAARTTSRVRDVETWYELIRHHIDA